MQIQVYGGMLLIAGQRMQASTPYRRSHDREAKPDGPNNPVLRETSKTALPEIEFGGKTR